MKTGKISESILKRSVLRQIKTHSEEVVKGAGVGEDCAFFAWKSSADALLAVSTQTISLPAEDAPTLAVLAAVNNLAAGGAKPFGVTVSLTLPQKTEEAFLQKTMGQIRQICEELAVELVGGHTEVSPWIMEPVITVTALGQKTKGSGASDERSDGKKGKSEESGKFAEKKRLEIVISKWIGLEGTYLLSKEKKEQLSGRYPLHMILAAQETKPYLSVLPEAALALKSGVYMMHDMRNGGIFGALWEISQRMGVGLSIDLKKIPVLQETIEICEFFELNPYQLLSGGSLIMLTEQGDQLAELLEKEGIPAVVIGSTNESNDKLVINEEETRYLEPPVPDEIYKVFA